MTLLQPVLLALSALLSISLANSEMNSRITSSVEGKRSFFLPKVEPNAVFYLSEDHSLYIGGEEILYHCNFETMKKYTIKAESNGCQGKPYCKNDITFVGQLLGKLTVCGTNANSPGCWTMNGENFDKLTYSWAQQLAPRTPTDHYNILIAGDQVYSTLPRRSNNGASVMTTSFRKLYGSNPLLYTGETFMRKPKFVKSLVVEKEDRQQSKILLFFTEDNTEPRTVEKRLPMVAQLCKEDSGSEKANIRFAFSTALKSRIICGNPQSGQYYPYLQDIYFMQEKNVIYGLFKNAWNHSAVCSYKLQDIELLFNTSSLLGSSETDLEIRPGTCLPSGTRTPEKTSEETSNHPELTEWLWPSGNKTDFYNLYNYRKIVVDEIPTENQTMSRVLLLATENGTVHTVVELEDQSFHILKVSSFNGTLQYMELESNENVLYIGTTSEIAKLSLGDCTAYNNSCTDCIQSRDPYCRWTDGKCESVLKDRSNTTQQYLQDNATCQTEKESVTMLLKGDRYTSANKEVQKTQYYLTCPTMSKHASYMWKNGDQKMSECNPSNDICELTVREVTSPGEYRCIVKEQETERAVVQYLVQESNTATQKQGAWALVLAIQFLMIASHLHMVYILS